MLSAIAMSEALLRLVKNCLRVCLFHLISITPLPPHPAPSFPSRPRVAIYASSNLCFGGPTLQCALAVRAQEPELGVTSGTEIGYPSQSLSTDDIFLQVFLLSCSASEGIKDSRSQLRACSGKV